MQLEVLLFAAARDAAGQASIEIEVDDDASAADVLAELAQQIPDAKELIACCRLAVDNAYADPQTSVSSAQEIALIPPVSGG